MDPTQLQDDTEPAPVRFGGRKKKGPPVYRVRANKGKKGAILGVAAGLVWGIIASRWLVLDPPYAVPLALTLAGTIIGFLRGSSIRADTCSECDASIALSSKSCPSCNGKVKGEIADRSERL